MKCRAHCNANPRGQGAQKTPVNCGQFSADCSSKMCFLWCGWEVVVQLEGPRTPSLTRSEGSIKKL